MKNGIWFGLALAGLMGTAGEAVAKQAFSGGSKPRCRSREVFEDTRNGVPGFCRAKERDGFRWVSDPNGGYFEPLTQRAGQVFTRGHAEGGRWVEAGWTTGKFGSIWVEGHYKTDGSWSPGYFEKGRAGQEWVNGFWKDGRWQDGFWRAIPTDSYCAANQTYVDSISLANLYVPEQCRENSRVGYTWNNDTYGGYWQPTASRPGQVFVRGHVTGDLGTWDGERWETEQPGKFFIQGRYDASGKWVAGKFEDVKRGHVWNEGKWGTDGSWTPGSWTYDPARACPAGYVLEEEIKFPKLNVPRYCRESSRAGYTWVDSPYGGSWIATKRPGQVFVRGHIDSEFGAWEGERWETDQPGKFFIQGRYDASGRWVAGEWKEVKKGNRWQDGSWGTDGSWIAGTYVFDPASACNAKETYVEEIKLSRLSVPRFCRPTNRASFTWVNDQYGGYWKPNVTKPGQVFVQGHIDSEFGLWAGERFESARPNYTFEQGHYDNAGKWIAGDFREVTPGYKYNSGKYNSDGSWVAGGLVEDPSWTPTCLKGQIVVPSVRLSKLNVLPFCRESKRAGMKWVASTTGGFWAPDVKGYSTGTKVFVQGHYDTKTGWTGESWLESQPGKVFVQGHYGSKGEWIEGKWIEAKAGFNFQPGSYGPDGSWIDGQWIEDKSGKGTGYGGAKGSTGGY